MRKDMAKIIVERPRIGRSRAAVAKPGRMRPVMDDDGDPLPVRAPEKRAPRDKHLNENLSPLKRYLGGQVGRPWNKVFAEISEHLKPTSTVQQHVRDHLEDFVAVKTRMKAGRVVMAGAGRWGRETPVEEGYWRFYVHPRTGLLKRNAKPFMRKRLEKDRRAAIAAERHVRMRELGPGAQAHLLNDGVWWAVTLAAHGYREPFEDVLQRAKLTDMPLAKLYGSENVHAIARRQLSSAEKKKLGLT